jgi:hypothetical protein
MRQGDVVAEPAHPVNDRAGTGPGAQPPTERRDLGRILAELEEAEGRRQEGAAMTPGPSGEADVATP